MESQDQKTDHDLLIELKTLMGYAIEQIKTMALELKTQNDSKVNKVEFDLRVNDHEIRLRSLEAYQDKSIGRNAVVSAIVSVIIAFVLSLLGFIKFK